MGIVSVKGRYYWVKRIPKKYQGVALGPSGKPVAQLRQALFTDSLAEATIKAAQVSAAKVAEWEALLAGDQKSAVRLYEAARDLAQARGFPYVPMSSLAQGDLKALVSRVLSLGKEGVHSESHASSAAVMGVVPAALPPLSAALSDYFVLTKTRHLKKSDAQRHKWKLPRERAVRHFLDLTCARDGAGNAIEKPIDQITRDEALLFRKWWSDRVEAGMAVGSANKDFGHLSEIFRTWAELKGVDLANPFSKLRLDGKDEGTKPPFSRDWILTKILVPGALDGLNEEARDVFLITLNSGCRPSEITDAPLEDFRVNESIPYLRISANGRELKVAHTRRDIPLLGVSLAAARRVVARGGIKRYRHKAGSWSGLVNKYLGNNGLKETPRHTAYSVRHYVENALLEVGVDDRVRADILGHKYERPSYGDGGGVAGRAKALALIAFDDKA